MNLSYLYVFQHSSSSLSIYCEISIIGKSDGSTSPAVIVLLENLVNAGKSGESSEGR